MRIIASTTGAGDLSTGIGSGTGGESELVCSEGVGCKGFTGWSCQGSGQSGASSPKAPAGSTARPSSGGFQPIESDNKPPPGYEKIKPSEKQKQKVDEPGNESQFNKNCTGEKYNEFLACVSNARPCYNRCPTNRGFDALMRCHSTCWKSLIEPCRRSVNARYGCSFVN